jgi:hypothetical protein
VQAIYGGRAFEPQVAALQAGVEIVVGTPGRLLDLAQQGHLVLGKVSVLVLDEADEMLDLGRRSGGMDPGSTAAPDPDAGEPPGGIFASGNGCRRAPGPVWTSSSPWPPRRVVLEGGTLRRAYRSIRVLQAGRPSPGKAEGGVGLGAWVCGVWARRAHRRRARIRSGRRHRDHQSPDHRDAPLLGNGSLRRKTWRRERQR